MRKRSTTRTPRRPQPDPIVDAAARLKRNLRRLIQGKRDLARLANELRRATARSDRALRDLAIDIAERQGEDELDARLQRGDVAGAVPAGV